MTHSALEVIGVSISGGAPPVEVDLRLGPNLHVLYGRNGSGKSTLLQQVTAALMGRRTAHGAELHVRIGEWSDSDDDDVAEWWTREEGFVHTLKGEIVRDIVESQRMGVYVGDVMPSMPVADLVEKSVHANLLLDAHEVEHRLGPANEDLIAAIAKEFAQQCYFTLVPVGDSAPAFRPIIACGPNSEAPVFARELQRLERAWTGHNDRTERLSNPNDEQALIKSDEILHAEIAGCPLYPLIYDVIDAQRVHHEWLPYALFPLGVVHAPLEDLSVIDPDAIDIEEQTRVVVRQGVDAAARSHPRFTDSAPFAPLPVATDVLKSASERASSLMARFLTGAPRLVASAPDPLDFMMQATDLWTAHDAYGNRIELGALSAAQERLARVAIAVALAELKGPREQKILVIDEPEAGLHRVAERQFEEALGGLAQAGTTTVLCGTHSPFLLRHAESRLHHVTRTTSGVVRTVPMSGLDRSRLSDLGLELPDVLQMVRLFIIVEGRHDEIVLSRVFDGLEGGLNGIYAHLLAMRGARHAASIVNAGILWEFTDAAVIVVVDKVPYDAARGAWDEAKRDVGNGMAGPDAAKRFRERLEALLAERGKARTDERKWLSELGTRALEGGFVERLELFGLGEDDVLAYLDPDKLRAGATSWKDAKGRELTDADVVRAVDALDHLPDDFVQLVELCRRRSEVLYQPVR